MASIYQVNPNELIEKVAQELKKLPGIQAPEWAQFVKTGVHKERAPVNPDWWYVRVAAVLRTVFIKGPVGVSKLRTKYGGKKNRGAAPERFVKGSGNILRKALQQLELESLVMKNNDDKKKGRVIAPKGQSILEKAAASLKPKVEKPAKAEKTTKATKEAKPSKEKALAKEEAKPSVDEKVKTPKAEVKAEVKEEAASAPEAKAEVKAEENKE
jgi:small subunit ribosomal protein S19e